MKAIVVAMDKNRGIGAGNDLLWQRDLPADLANFKRLTTGGSVIMGRKTFESIGRPLPNRQNVVITRQPDFIAEGALVVGSLQDAYEIAEHDIFVIGGGEIYTQALDDVDRLYATEVGATFPVATVFFPSLNERWRETSRTSYPADEQNKYAFDFVIYEKKQ